MGVFERYNYTFVSTPAAINFMFILTAFSETNV